RPRPHAVRIRRARLRRRGARLRRDDDRAGVAGLSRAVRASGGNGCEAAVCFLAALLVCAVRRAARRQSAGAAWAHIMNDDDGIVLTEEQKRRRRARSIAIALSLGALV